MVTRKPFGWSWLFTTIHVEYFCPVLRCSRTNSTRQISVNQSNFWNMIFYHFFQRFSKFSNHYGVVFLWIDDFWSKTTHQIDVKWLKINSKMNQGAFLLKKSCFIADLKLLNRPLNLSRGSIFRRFHNFRSKISGFEIIENVWKFKFFAHFVKHQKLCPHSYFDCLAVFCSLEITFFWYVFNYLTLNDVFKS